MPDHTDPVKGPRSREKALSAAYLRLMGATQEEAAEAAGCGERTLRQWEACSWWPEIEAEASHRWLRGLASAARRSLTLAVQEDGRLAMRVLERLEPSLAPPRDRVEVSSDIRIQEDRNPIVILPPKDPPPE